MSTDPNAAQAPAVAARETSTSTVIQLPSVTDAVTPFQVTIPREAIEDLRNRLRTTRWVEQETVEDWSQGVPLMRMRALVDYWLNEYDTDRLGKRLNAVPQFRSSIDGLGIHFLHVRSKHANALPMVLTHGWPGSVLEFLDVIGPLTDPQAHGGTADDAFHLVIPSLPGYGFSDKPSTAGYGLPRIAGMWATLMARLGYDRWVAQGGDWGAGVATWLAKLKADGLAGIHLNLPILFPPPLVDEPDDDEQAAIAQLMKFDSTMSGYSKIQSTRPQTLGYGLLDSPVGQAAWIYEKFAEWADYGDDLESAVSRDVLLDNIMLYWLTGTAASAARLYAESYPVDASRQELDIPVGVSLFGGDNFLPPKVWGERTYSKLIYWQQVDNGGHFAALEQPQLFTEQLRSCFALLRR